MPLTKVIGSGIGTVTNQFTDANMSAGSVIQVIEARLLSQFSTTSTSMVETGLRLSITPTDNNNKILLLSTFSLYHSTAFMYVTIFRNHSGISDTNLETQSGQALCQLHAAGAQGSPSCISIFDSPATTNEVTYNVRVRVQNGTGYFNINTSPAFLHAMEVQV